MTQLCNGTNLICRTGRSSLSSAMQPAVDCGVPHGSVLVPLQFIAYTEDVMDIFQRHGVSRSSSCHVMRLDADAQL